jgi:hypothetical protein
MRQCNDICISEGVKSLKGETSSMKERQRQNYTNEHNNKELMEKEPTEGELGTITGGYIPRYSPLQGQPGLQKDKRAIGFYGS